MASQEPGDNKAFEENPPAPYSAQAPPYGAPPPMPAAAPPYGAQPYAAPPMPGAAPPYGGAPQPYTQQPAIVPYPAAPYPPGAPQMVIVSPFVPPPPTIPNCPVGLEYLTAVDQLLIHQKIELLEMITGFETQNKYEIKNAVGQQVYFAAEQSDCLSRQCCGPIRPFEMKITDNSQRVVLELRRPCRCQECCYPCCLQRLEVYAQDEQLLGVIKQDWSLCKPRFTVYNAEMDPVAKINGPCITCRCCSDVKFPVSTLDGNEIGCVSKQWSGILKESYTDADNFSVTFPMDMDVKTKATLVASAFLIDFMFFETKENNNN